MHTSESDCKQSEHKIERKGEMEMEKKNSTGRGRPHCVVLSYPAQGHINPMIQLSKLLIHEGVRVSLVTTRFFCKSMQKEKVPASMSVEGISDGFDNGRPSGLSNKAYLDRFWQVGPQTLADLLHRLQKTESPVHCIIYDSFLSWTLDVASQFGIVGAVYLTQNMAVNSIYYHTQLGNIKLPLTLSLSDTEDQICLPAMPTLQHRDMPSFFFTYQQDPASFEMLVTQFANIHKADWILCNVFYELDKQLADWTRKTWPKFRTIGPNIPSTFLDKRVKDDEDYGAAQFQSEGYSMEWLDAKPKGSVIYVSFGSLVPLDEEQIVEVASALTDISTSYSYLWVVRASEEAKLPKEFAKRSERGLVVRWCSQLKVLDHEAVGCFVTHCGWNSTLETLSLGVATVAVPQWSDQSTNAKYLEHVWRVGIRAPFDDKKIVRAEALKQCIREVMESEKGREMKNNAIHWKTLATQAVTEGGTSHTNLMEFVNSLYHPPQQQQQH